MPYDNQILEFDMEKLYRDVTQHEKNIVSFSQAIADEKVRIQHLKNIIQRKKQLEKDLARKQEEQRRNSIVR
jgi:hypothetical protein